MSIKFKDYYQTLGVSKDASPDAIKKSFRDLARRFHPDKVQGSGKGQAETRFKEINEAYEVLGSPEKREKYDRLGADWDQPQGRGRHPRAWVIRRRPALVVAPGMASNSILTAPGSVTFSSSTLAWSRILSSVPHVVRPAVRPDLPEWPGAVMLRRRSWSRWRKS